MALSREYSSSRRQWLRAGAGMAIALGTGALAGCGFALRQAPSFAFTSLRLAGSTGSPVARALLRELPAAGVQVVTAARAPTDTAAAQVVLTIMADQRERVVVGQLANGQVRELELRYRFRFRLENAAGRVLLEEDEILLERDISFSETAVLAKTAEEYATFNDMQGDVTQQVMRRLASVKAI